MLKKPLSAPMIEDILRETAGERIPLIIARTRHPLIAGEYAHWDKVFRLPPPEGLTSREWWLGIRWARQSVSSVIPLRDRQGDPFAFSMLDPVFESLHRVDMAAGGRIEMPDPITDPSTRDRYYVNSLIEEAITSSQLEGAGTTRQVAREMLRTNRPPRDRGERMILNNYLTMRRIGELKAERLTPELVMDIHRLVTEGTLDDRSAAARFRRDDEDVVVGDMEGNVLHKPPDASELPARLEAMCRFANGEEPGRFIHPVVRAIILHFWLAYDHPFVDGNGRTARALFYWSMLRQGFWLFEFVSISTIIRKSKARYLRAFLQTETDMNDLTYFLIYHLRVMEEAIEELNAYLARKAARLQLITEALSGFAALNHRQKALVAHALRHPGHGYSIESHQGSHRVAYQTARTDLLGLENLGLLERIKAGKAYRFYAAPNMEAILSRLPA